MSWQTRYDNLEPEDFYLSPIQLRCNTEILEEFLEEQKELNKQKEGAVTPSPS